MKGLGSNAKQHGHEIHERESHARTSRGRLGLGNQSLRQWPDEILDVKLALQCKCKHSGDEVSI